MSLTASIALADFIDWLIGREPSVKGRISVKEKKCRSQFEALLPILVQQLNGTTAF